MGPQANPDEAKIAQAKAEAKSRYDALFECAGRSFVGRAGISDLEAIWFANKTREDMKNLDKEIAVLTSKREHLEKIAVAMEAFSEALKEFRSERYRAEAEAAR